MPALGPTRAALLAIATLCACQATQLESAAGRHVVLHWDPSEHHVCGGTLEYVDRSLEVVAQRYGVELPARPAVDLFLSEDLSLALALCRREAGGCTATYPNGTALMVLNRPVHPHELTHAIRLTGDRDIMPRIFREGVAVRWEPGPAEVENRKAEYLGDLDYRSLHEQLDHNEIIASDYLAAGFLWSWLEAEYGPETMTAFASGLRRGASAATIERAFAETFGVSLEAATEASRGSPLPMFDVHACAMPLPTLRWADEPLTLDQGPGRCADEDLVDIRGRAVRMIRLELPEQAQGYRLEIVGEDDVELRFDPCLGVPRAYAPAQTFGPREGGISIQLAGSHVVSSYATIAEDGSVDFPTVELSRP